MSHSRHCRHYSKENYSDRHAALYNAPFPHTLCHKFLFEPVRTIHMPMKGENNTIIALKSTHSIHEALSILSKYDISSAPVIDVEGSNQVLGLVDYADLLEYTIRVIEETASLGPITDFNVQLEQSERFSATRVIEVMDISARDPLWSVYVDDPYSTVLDILSRHGLHRVLVTDSATGNPVCIVTQSAIVEMLANNAEEIFGPKMDETIGKLFNAYTLVHKINQKTSALSAFKLMRSERVSAVAVVDDEDRLVGSLSVKDLREVSIQEAMLDRLLLPIPQFLSKVHTETQAPVLPIHCTPDETLRDLMRKFRENPIHRIWVTDAEHRPVGVIALRDFLWWVLLTAANEYSANE